MGVRVGGGEMGTRTWGRNMLTVIYVYENVLK